MIGLRTWRVALGVILGSAIGVASGMGLSGSPAASRAPTTQDVGALGSRFRMLEQRLYSIESSIRRLDQQAVFSQRTNTPPAGGQDPEIGGLRSEVNALRSRLVEIECGLFSSTPVRARPLLARPLGDRDKTSTTPAASMRQLHYDFRRDRKQSRGRRGICESNA